MRDRTYRDRVVVERPAGSPDGHGQTDQTDPANWEPHCERYAEVLHPAAGERTADGQTRAEGTVVVTLRADGDTRAADAKMRVRVVRTGSVLGIVGVRPVGNDGREIAFDCRRADA